MGPWHVIVHTALNISKLVFGEVSERIEMYVYGERVQVCVYFLRTLGHALHTRAKRQREKKKVETLRICPVFVTQHFSTRTHENDTLPLCSDSDTHMFYR